MKYILIISFCFLSLALSSQNSLKDILRSSKSFQEIVEDGESYFRQKNRTNNLKKLTQGEQRDGEYVKFMRWQSYWKNSLNPDGTLGDISAYHRKSNKEDRAKAKSRSPYLEVKWSNISYNDYMISQIGLGRTTCIGFHPTNANIFYVGAAIGGIWKTTDGGQNYTPLGDDLPYLAVSNIVVKKDQPNKIFIATGDHLDYGVPSIGVYKSTNSGTTWLPSALNFEMKDGVTIHWMEADPNNSNKMFVATTKGLYLTTDLFVTVTKINNVPSFDIKINPGNSNIVYQGGLNGEFYRSTNGGSSFSLIKDFGNGSVYSAVTSLNTSKVYVRNDSLLHKSTNNGASFSSTTNEMPVKNSVLAFAPNNDSILLAGNFENNRSDNNGATFYKTSDWNGDNGLPMIHVDQRNIFTNPLESDFVYYCNDGGLYRYILSSNSFDNLCNGLQITQFYDIAVSQTDKNVLSGGSQDNGNVFRNSNGVWDNFAPTGDGMNQEIDPTNANIRYWAYQNGSIHRWVNGTDSHITPSEQINSKGETQGAWETPFKLDPSNSDRIVIGYDRVYSSTNKGDDWTDISGDIFGGTLNELAIAKSNSDRIYVTRENTLFVKNIDNNSWTQKNLPGSLSDLEISPTNMDEVYITIPGFILGSKVYKSIDAGSTWANISGSLPNVSVDAIEMYENIPGAMFIGTDIGVYYRDNIQLDWHEYGSLPHTRVQDIEIQYSEKTIRVGTYGRGVLEASIIIEECDVNDSDADNDGICDANDPCPSFNNNFIGQPCDDGDIYSSGETFSVNCECEGGSSNLTYCFSEGAAGTGSDWIERVRLNSLDHSSGKTAYSDFRNKSTSLAMGSTYTLNVDLNYAFPLDSVYAWIDYDRNGNFEASELIIMSSLNSNKCEGTVIVPSDVGFGATTMRVRVIYAAPNTAQACGSLSGEVEDYSIHFTYCDAAGHFSTGDDWIKNVRLNTVDHSSVQLYYSDFKHNTTDLLEGGSYPIEVQLNFAFNINRVYVWIDFNHNRIFEASEQISMSDLAVGNNQLSTGTVIVPIGAIPGETMMRVRTQYGNPNSPDACNSNAPGEVEDYMVIIATDPCEVDIALLSPYHDVAGAALFTSTNKSIYATNKITGTSSVDYSAGAATGEAIYFNQGFEVGLNTNFKAYMAGCGGSNTAKEVNTNFKTLQVKRKKE